MLFPHVCWRQGWFVFWAGDWGLGNGDWQGLEVPMDGWKHITKVHAIDRTTMNKDAPHECARIEGVHFFWVLETSIWNYVGRQGRLIEGTDSQSDVYMW